jgi:2-C-methyl-D-erythritol 4-phosphate cytidylyltransferase
MPRSSDDGSAVTVLVPAAGRGTRLGGERKQLRSLGGLPLVVQTLRAFEAHPAVDHLVVAAPADDVRTTAERLEAAALHKLVAVVPGGASRQASVGHALRAAPTTTSVVLVHDAVRPFVPHACIGAVVDAVRAHGAAALAVPLADTLRTSDGEAFGETVPRAGLYRMQTPQGFRRNWLEAAHAAAARADDAPPATDDVALVQRLGHRVRLVPGDARNFKVTTPGDWTLAQALWPLWTKAARRT